MNNELFIIELNLNNKIENQKKDAEFFDYADDEMFMDEDDTILMIEVSE